MKHILFIISLLLAAPVVGQSVELKVSADSILVGNYIKVEFVIENLDGDFEAPEFPNCSILSGPNMSSSIQIINGDKSSSLTYSYYIKPNQLGTTMIPPAFIVDGENTYETLPLELNVYPNPENILEEPKEENVGSFFEFKSFDPFQSMSPREPAQSKEPKKKKRKYKKI